MDFTILKMKLGASSRRFVCLIPSISIFLLAISIKGYAEHPKIDWEFLGHKDGITSEGGILPNSSLKAFRGTAIIDARIGLVISALFDHRRAPEWIDGLEQSVELRALANHGVLVWQQFNNPWPVMDRIFIYQATPEYNLDKQFFRAQFIDVDQTPSLLSPTERDKISDQSCCILGKIIHAEWQFRGTSQNATCARVEVVMDPKGWVPAVFVNWFQETWPQRTLAGLRKQVKKPSLTLHPDFGQWSATLPNTRITPEECQHGQFER